MFENPRRGRQARNFTTNVPKILVLKSSSEQIFSRKLPLGAPEARYLSTLLLKRYNYRYIDSNENIQMSQIFSQGTEVEQEARESTDCPDF